MVISNLTLAMGQYRKLIQHNSIRPTARMLKIYETEKGTLYAMANEISAGGKI
jgi:hypothetical protein